MKAIDNFLNGITMYRLILYGISLLLGYGLLVSTLGELPFTGLELIVTSAVLYLSCSISNMFFSKVFRVQTNTESATITSLILALVLYPTIVLSEIWVFVLAGVLAMASKYLLAINRKHIFNPAAVSLLMLDLMGLGVSIWWVGSSTMLPVVAIVGLLIVRKIRRFNLLFAFLLSALVVILFSSRGGGTSLFELVSQVTSSWPIIFFGTIMLTEPLTTPPSKKWQIVYGVLVGILFGAKFEFGRLYTTPELALILGNLFSYVVSFKQRAILVLREKLELAPGIYEFLFNVDKKFNYLPGQYMEWTLGHSQADSRGVRRYFTLASSPTETEVHLAMRYEGKESSSFKKAVLGMQVGGKLTVSQVAGDFVLPQDKNKKLVFIAGGIGITPFRSMIKYLMDKKEKRTVSLFYICKRADERIYTDLFTKAKEVGLKTKYIFTSKGEHFGVETLEAEVKGLGERTFYISGPNKMVDSVKQVLADMGVKSSQIVTDYFPGY